ncbi:MAG: hypothetical protein AAFX92_12225 [Pseudomonadota bacterium]
MTDRAHDAVDRLVTPVLQFPLDLQAADDFHVSMAFESVWVALDLIIEPLAGSHAGITLGEQRAHRGLGEVGNHRQLFDLDQDPDETEDLAGDPACEEILQRLTDSLVDQLYGTDEAWLDGTRLVGEPARTF